MITRFPESSEKQHHKTFWDAVEGSNDKLVPGWKRRDRLSANPAAKPAPSSVKRRKTMTKPQIVKYPLKKYNLERAMKNVMQIDVGVFKQLKSYRQRIQDNRELVYQLEDFLNDF